MNNINTIKTNAIQIKIIPKLHIHNSNINTEIICCTNITRLDYNIN